MKDSRVSSGILPMYQRSPGQPHGPGLEEKCPTGPARALGRQLIVIPAGIDGRGLTR
jgi:hypothetical protein